jgi:DHA2 family multidrug resistance protein
MAAGSRHPGGGGDAVHPALQQGAAMLNAEITRQSQVIAYVDDFKLMRVLSVRMLPLVLLTRPPRVAALAKK